MFNQFGFRVSSVKKNPNNNFMDQDTFSRPKNFGLSEVSSLRKVSTGMKFNPNHGFNNNAPSTAKSVDRLRPQSFGFSSMKKSGVSSKLFGMTPQQTRQSHVPSSTSRISRVSSSGRQFKDNRPLSDPSYHRECQAKIFNFLTENDYPHQLTKQTLVRPSLSDVCKIFEYLLSFFIPDIMIRNGSDTSIDQVVPKTMASIGYMFPIKRSDLVSFSGGRQLGSVLAMLDFLVDAISYSKNLDINRLLKPDLDLNENEVDDNYVSSKLIEISLEFDTENIDERLANLSKEIFGTQEDVDQLQKKQENLEQTSSKLDEDLEVLQELPIKIEKTKIDLENCEKYIQELIEHNNANLKIKDALQEDIELKKETKSKIIDENRELEKQVDSQQEIRIEYQLCIEKCKQLTEEMENSNLQKKMFEEMNVASILEINKFKAENSSMLNDIDDVICAFFESLKIPIICKFLPDLSKMFEQDNEWIKLYESFKKFKTADFENFTDEEFSSYQKFISLLVDKFRDFQLKLLNNLSSLKGTVYLNMLGSNQEKKRDYDKMKQALFDNEASLKVLIEEKENNAKIYSEKLKNLNQDVENVRTKCLSLNNKLTTSDDEQCLKSLEEKIKSLELTNENKRQQMMEILKEKIKQNYDFYKQNQIYLRNLTVKLKKDNQLINSMLNDVNNFAC